MREPVYEVVIREAGTKRIVHHEIVRGRLMPVFSDLDSTLRRKIEAEDRRLWFRRTEYTERRRDDDI